MAPAATGVLSFDDVAARVAGIPFMEPSLARRVYDHIRETRPEAVLEIGTAHGVSAAYMAAALEANGRGHVTTVDHGAAAYDPAPEDVLARAGVGHRVTLVRRYSSYNWWLKEAVEERSDPHGNVTPIYDFVYLDGAHNFVLDGLAVVLIEKLMRPGAWLLMDDLEWTYRDNPWFEPRPAADGNAAPFGPMSDEERDAPQVRAVFDVIVKQHPSFTRFVDEDAWYGWAQKNPDAPRRYELASSRPLSALVMTELRRRWHTYKSRTASRSA
jgi:predicted O-methyltransferase YrrM